MPVLLPGRLCGMGCAGRQNWNGAERNTGRKGEKSGDGEDDTQRLFHEESPLSGANVRKNSLVLYRIQTKEKNA